MGSSARNGSRHSARETRRTIPVLPARSTVMITPARGLQMMRRQPIPAIAANSAAEVKRRRSSRLARLPPAWSWRAILVGSFCCGASSGWRGYLSEGVDSGRGRHPADCAHGAGG
jgi:hypothetical protein